MAHLYFLYSCQTVNCSQLCDYSLWLHSNHFKGIRNMTKSEYFLSNGNPKTHDTLINVLPSACSEIGKRTFRLRVSPLAKCSGGVWLLNLFSWEVRKTEGFWLLMKLSSVLSLCWPYSLKPSGRVLSSESSSPR